MALNPSNRLKVNHLVIVLGGLVMLTASVLTFLLILKNLYGNVSMAKFIPTSSNMREVFANQNYNAAILYSKYTENKLPEGSTWLVDNINTWKTSLSHSRVKYQVISDQDLENGKHLKYKILILPGAKSLSDREIIQIKKFLENGGSVFATSGIASYSNDGKWRGWDFFSEVFGLNFTGEISSTDMTRIHTLRGGLPLTTGIPPGYSLKVATWDRPMSCEILDPRTVQVSFWYNFRKEMGLVSEEITKTAGIVYGTYGKGRFVWMGFELNSVIGQQEDYIYFDKLFKNSLAWLAYRPTVFVKTWPGKYQSAAVIVPTLTNDMYNVENLLPILKSEGVPAAFFVDGNYVADNSQMLSRVARYGELGAVVDVGYIESVRDTVNKLFTYDYQLRSFKTAKWNFTKKIKGSKTYSGISPLYGFYNENSIRALIYSGYQYVITDSLTDRSVPKIIERGDKKILAFTKTARDDYEIIRNYGLAEPEFQSYTYKEDINRLLFEGGLYMLKIHSDYQMRPEYVGVVRDLIRYMKSKNIWITTPSEIRNWWITRNQVEISTDVRSAKRVAIEITNPGNYAVSGIEVYVSLNKDVHNLSMTSEMFGEKIPRYSFDPSRQLLIIKCEYIPAHGSNSYFIDYDEN